MIDPNLATVIVSTGGSVLVGIFGMFFTANQLGRRIDDTNARISELRVDFRELRSEFYTFREVVNSKFAALDLEIAKLMDKRN